MIAEFVKMERKKAGLTQEEFAERSGLGLRSWTKSIKRLLCLVWKQSQGKWAMILNDGVDEKKTGISKYTTNTNQSTDALITYEPKSVLFRAVRKKKTIVWSSEKQRVEA